MTSTVFGLSFIILMEGKLIIGVRQLCGSILHLLLIVGLVVMLEN